MAFRLLELGSLGRPPAAEALFKFVESFEDPAYGLPVDKLPPQSKAVVAKLRNEARQRRQQAFLDKPVMRVDGLGDIFSALGGAITSIAGYVQQAAQSPAFMQALGTAANFVPKVGPQLSQALASMYPKNPTGAVQAAGTAQAIATQYPNQAGAAGMLMGALPPQGQAQANAFAQSLIPGVDPAFLNAALAALGQFTATQTLMSGAGATGNPMFQMLAQSILQNGGSNIRNAYGAGSIDLLNKAILTGEQDAVAKALRAGAPSLFPWEYVALGAGGFILLLILVSATRA